VAEVSQTFAPRPQVATRGSALGMGKLACGNRYPHGISAVQPGSGSAPDLTVVIATRDRPGLLDQSLRALVAALRPSDRAIVVDSASHDPAVARVASEHGVRLVRCDRPGTCRARNRGLDEARSEVVAFLDDDCIAHRGWAEAMAASFRTGEPDFVTGRIVACSSSDVVHDEIGADSEGRGAHGADGPRAAGHRRAQLSLSLYESTEPMVFGDGDDPAVMGHGANMAWRRDVLERLGGFDEAMGPGAPLRAAEDQDLFWRAVRAGRTGRFEPAAVVAHQQWRSRRASLAAYHGYGVGSGALAVKQWRVLDEAARGAELPFSVMASRALREIVLASGLPAVARNLLHGYEMGALAELVQTAGAMRGALRARSLPLVGERFPGG
jgi:GT2 family glycosyltransferase